MSLWSVLCLKDLAADAVLLGFIIDPWGFAGGCCGLVPTPYGLGAILGKGRAEGLAFTTWLILCTWLA